MKMTIAVIGLGLIGGSFCKAISTYTSHRCVGYDRDASVIAQACQTGAIAAEIAPHQLGQADLVVVALHPRATIAFVEEYQEVFRPGSIVIDCAGVKQAVVQTLTSLLAPRKVTFLATHPMAGREYSGFAYATADLFQGASWLITPTELTPPAAIETITLLGQQLGFSTVLPTTPKQHDQVIAFTSQMAHLVSNAYVKSPTGLQQAGFSAGSFLDLTRVAKLNEHLWAELFCMNREPLIQELERFQASLSEYLSALQAADEPRLRELLRAGRICKEQLSCSAPPPQNE